jgi:predicted DNA-binding transcriptional regulator AlpA
MVACAEARWTAHCCRGAKDIDVSSDEEVAVERFHTTEELAELARVSPATVRWWRHQGTGPKGVKFGRRVLYRDSDIKEWIDARLQDDQVPA